MTDLQPIAEFLPDEPRKRRKAGRSPDEAELNPNEELVLELVHLGVALRKAQHLVETYSASRITRQLAWLPLRSPRRPAPLLIAAIEHDYERPAYASE